MFQTAIAAYFRMVSIAIHDLSHGKARQESIKRIAIFQFLLPALFMWAYQGFELEKDDEDKFSWTKNGRLFGIGAMSGAYLIGPILENMYNKSVGNNFSYHLSPIGQMFEDTTGALSDVAKYLDALWSGEESLDFIDLEAYSKELLAAFLQDSDYKRWVSVASQYTGMPFIAGYKHGSALVDMMEGEDLDVRRLLLGYSSGAIPSLRHMKKSRENTPKTLRRGRLIHKRIK
jgi:hypothetical protein